MVRQRLILCGLVLSCCTVANAALVHRYSFTSNANDSIGTAHGTVIDAGAATAVFAGGVLDLSANTGQGSNAITEDAFVDLPNGIVSAAAAGGAVSFEFWASVAETRTWQRFGDFGISNNGENTSASGDMSQYVLITPNSGRFMNGLEITNHPASNLAEPNVGVNGPFPAGNQHVLAVYDHNDATAGPNGTMTLYHNGALVGSNQIHPDVHLTDPIDLNNWLGRSQWNDPVFDGSFDEFRIYNSALSGAAVADSFQRGPNFIPEPTTIAAVVLAVFGLGMSRRGRRAAARPAE